MLRSSSQLSSSGTNTSHHLFNHHLNNNPHHQIMSTAVNTGMIQSGFTSSGRQHKVFVFGMKKSGKTCLLDQLLYGNQAKYSLPKDPPGTLEDIYSAVVDNEDRGVKETIHFFETPGFATINHFSSEFVKNYLNYADGIILVYAINSKESFHIIEAVKKAIDKYKDKKDIPVIVLGNKIDRFRERQVSLDEVNLWSIREKVKLTEVTATERKTLMEPILYLASRLNPVQTKSGFPRLGPAKGSKGSTSTTTIPLEL